MAYDKNNELVEALLNQHEAMEIFDQELNIRRYLFVKVHIANTLSRNHSYLKAENIYLSILEQAKQSNLNFMIYITLENHIWNLIKQHKYIQAKDILVEIDDPSISNYTPNYYFQSALIFYYLNDINNSLLWINKGKEIIKDEIILFKLNVIEQLISSNKQELILSIKSFLNNHKDHLESETISFLVNIFIELCEELHYYKDAFYFQKRYMKYLV